MIKQCENRYNSVLEHYFRNLRVVHDILFKSLIFATSTFIKLHVGAINVKKQKITFL